MPISRREFIKLCSALGVTLPITHGLTGCRSESEESTSSPRGPVLIIGAGPAGLSAGYLLHQRGIEFQILEAAPTHGGRIKRASDFVDFPIPLGAEWIHVEPSILKEIVNDPGIPVEIRTTRYDSKSDVFMYEGEEITLKDLDFTEDSKFIGSSWFDFFEEYIVPSVGPHIRYNAAVKQVDTSGDRVEVHTTNGTVTGAAVIVAVPVKLLQLGSITFTPELPVKKQNAIQDVEVWGGCKAFIEFSKAFYPTITAFKIRPRKAGHKLFYDAAYGQDSEHHVLGLFAVGSAAQVYNEMKAEERLPFMLRELDELFDGQATPNYIQHLFQNWNEEPYAQGAYVMDYENWRTVRELGKPISDRLLFAGDAYTDGEDWSSVHAAARSARRAVDQLLS